MERSYKISVQRPAPLPRTEQGKTISAKKIAPQDHPGGLDLLHSESFTGTREAAYARGEALMEEHGGTRFTVDDAD